MTQEEENVLQEVVSPDQQQTSEPSPDSSSPPETQEVAETQEATEVDPQEKNWRELRQSLKELKRENQQLYSRLVEQTQGPSSKKEEEPVDEDELVTYKTLKSYEKKLENKLRQKEAETVVDRLKSRYKDFEEVVTPENIEFLKENEPELVTSLQALHTDPYAQANAAYKLLKKTDYYMNSKNIGNKKKAQDNAKKPVSPNAVQQSSALADANRFANGLTPELRKSLWKEMQDSRKMA